MNQPAALEKLFLYLTSCYRQHILTIFLSICFFCLHSSVFAQDIDPISIEKLLSQAHLQATEGSFSDAYESYVSIANQYKALQDWNQYVNVISEMEYDLAFSPFRQPVFELVSAFHKDVRSGNVQGLSLNSQNELYLIIGDLYVWRNEYEQSLAAHQTALSILKDASIENEALAKTYHRMGLVYFQQGNYDSALFALSQAQQTAEKLQDRQQLEKTLTLMAMCFEAQRKFDSNIEILLQLTDILAGREEQKGLLGTVYTSLSKTYIELGDYQTALTYGQKALQIYPEGDYGIRAAENNIGLCYKNLGDYDRAIQFYEQSASNIADVFGDFHSEMIEAYVNLGNMYTIYQKDYGKGSQLKEKALQIIQATYGDQSLETAEGHLWVAESHVHSPSYFPLTQHHLDQAKTILFQLPVSEESRFLTGLYYADLAVLSHQKGNKESAVDHYTRSLAIFHELEDREQAADIQIKLGRLYMEMDLLDQALLTYQEGLKHIDPSFHPTAMSQNPHFDSIAQKQDLVDLIIGKGQVMRAQYTVDGRRSSYDHAHRQLTLADSLLDRLRNEFPGRQSQFEISDLSKKVVDARIHLETSAYAYMHNRDHLDSAFLYAERGKAHLLRAGFKQSTFHQVAGIPDSLIQYETQLKRRIAFLEKERFLLDGDDFQGKKNELTQQLFDVRDAYRSLTQELQQEYPSYFSLQYSQTALSIAKIQQDVLQEESAYLNYHIGQQMISVFVLTQDTFIVCSIDKDDGFEGLVRRLISYAKNPFVMELESPIPFEQQADSLILASHLLYKKLFSPIEERIKLPKRIILSPDPVLAGLPFDILLKELPANPLRFSQHRYLLKDHQISYAYSAHLLQEMQEQQHTAMHGRFIAFAPSFTSKVPSSKDPRASLSPLAYNIPEVISINKIMDGNIFLDTTATEANFVQYAPFYRIIHLATHGKANHISGDYSYLAFADIPDSEENEFFYTGDLYTLRLNADMVVLSACETGVGELLPGEGVMSLARGFSYAGAKSIITTMWNINDAATSELMISFYDHIDAGMDKDEALQAAKINYLHSHEFEDSHPFYWGAFVAIGDMSALPSKAWSSWIWLCAFGGGILVLGLVLFSYVRRKIHQSHGAIAK